MSSASALSFERFDPLTIPLDRSVVVEASAGTGKTYSITLLYLRCVLEEKLDPSRILVVTFTRAATAELRHRIRGGLHKALAFLVDPEHADATRIDPVYRRLLERFVGDGRADARSRLASALDMLDRASIVTIDGFLQRILHRFAFESGERFESEVAADPKALSKRVADDLFTAMYATLDVAEFEQRVFADPDYLGTLLRAVVEHPRLPLFPPDVDPAGFELAERRFASAKRAYREARAAAGSFEAILAAVRSVRTQVSKLDALPHLDALSEDAAAPTTRRPDKWEYLSARDLVEQKNGAKLRSIPLFDAVDELLDASRAMAVARIAREANRFASEGRRIYDERTRAKGILTYASVKNAIEARLADGERGRALAATIASEFGIALVDESQDTDVSQAEIFRRIFDANGRGLVFIGDPKQAIYGFRGADVHAYLDARATATHRFTMTSNFRSRPELVRSLDLLYRRAHLPFGDSAIGYPTVEPGLDASALPSLADPDSSASIELIRTREGGDAIVAVADDVVRTLARTSLVRPDGGTEPLRPRNVAVLCSSNKDVDEVCRALRVRGVPSVATSNQSVFDSEEAANLEALIRAALDPRDARAVRAVLYTPLFGFDVPGLRAISEDDAGWNAIVDTLVRLRDDLQSRGIGYAFARFVRERRLVERLLVRPDGYRVVTNFTHVVELAMRASSERKLGAEGLLAFLERARAGDVGDDMATEERSLRLEHAGDAVEVVTIHKSKGLEYDVVYVVGIGRVRTRPAERVALVRMPAVGRVVVADLSADDELRALRKEELRREESRLVYVALTRAKLAVRIVVETLSAKSRTGLGSTPLGDVLVGPALDSKAPDGDEFFDSIDARFASLRDEHGASIALRLVASESDAVVRFVGRTVPPTLEPPAPTRRTYESASRTSSFSGLTADAESLRADDRDRSIGTSSDVEADSFDPLEAAPAGRDLGVLVHAAFETLDFAGDDAAIRASVDAALASARAFAPHREAIVTTVRRSLDTPLTESGVRLADVPMNRTFRELEFHLSVRASSGFGPEALAETFRRHATPSVDARYADAIARLGFDDLKGFLRGFVDLVFEHGGRFYVVDYKSNRLGAASRYTADALVEPMTHHHYVLQYAIYTLALHRMLRQRLRGYDYDAHVGGSLYLFVRGMRPELGASSGVYSDRLSRGFVDALDRLFEEGAS